MASSFSCDAMPHVHAARSQACKPQTAYSLLQQPPGPGIMKRALCTIFVILLGSHGAQSYGGSQYGYGAAGVQSYGGGYGAAGVQSYGGSQYGYGAAGVQSYQPSPPLFGPAPVPEPMSVPVPPISLCLSRRCHA